MKSSHSNSVPPRRNSNFMTSYEPRYTTVWPNRMETSPPPPYSSGEGFQQSIPSSPSVQVESSNRSQRNADHPSRPPQTSTEYTPLLEDFTRKFVDSQLSVPILHHGSTSQLVPPELLVLCQQQSPYNPNFDSVSTTSSTTSDYSRHNSVSLSAGICHSSSYSNLRWFVCNFILLFTLMSFNFGMLISPQFYSNFFLVFLSNNNATIGYNHHHALHSIMIDLLLSSLIQIVLTVVATGSGLILIYYACTLHKRFNFSLKNRIHMSNQSPFPLFFIHFERIVYETLGAFMARLLSLILTVYLFLISSIYILILSDYLDTLLSLVTFDQIRQKFCQHVWFLDHDAGISIWLTLWIVILFGVNSFRRRKHTSSLSFLKNMAAFVGFFSVAYLIFIVIYIFVNTSSSQILNSKRLYFSDSDKQCQGSTWTCLNQSWILLISSIPLLLLPFHISELLIILLFASKRNQPLPRKSLVQATNQQSSMTNGASSGGVGPSTAISSTSRSVRRQFADMHLAGPPLHHLPRRLNHHEGMPWGQQPEHTMLDDTVMATEAVNPIAEPSVHLTSLSSLFSRPLHSFSSVRNLFVSVTFCVCLLNIIVNAFVYISAFKSTTSFKNDVIQSTRDNGAWLPSHFQSGSPTENILLLDFNFLRNYLLVLEPQSIDGKPDSNQSRHRYLLIAAASLMILKTTLTYLLLAFRAMVAYQTLTGNKQDTPSGSHRVGCFLNSLLFTSPFLIWNLLVLLFSLFVERSTILLNIIFLFISFLGIFLVFIFPALIILYLSFKSLKKHSHALNFSYTLLSVAFKPLRYAKSCLALGLCMLAIGLFYLVFLPYAAHMSLLPSFRHSNLSSLYCPASANQALTI